ncbi:MAG TPA: PQQ-dependent dehydrogenase, methanol/ethanol family [Gemmatimonadales bacterium]
MRRADGRTGRRAVFAALGFMQAAVASAQQPARPSARPPVRPSDWPSPARDLGGSRFTPLGQLTPQNVSRLRLLWSFGTGSLEGHEGNPLVVGRRLYLHTPHPVAVYAFDLEQPGAPPLWKYGGASRDPAPAVCCGLGSRGIAWHPSGKLYVPHFPGDLAAIDARTGREIWRVRNGDPRTGLTMPAAPLVVGDVVIVGVAGGEFGARGYLTAYEALTGRLLWRGFSTGSDAEVLLPGPANPAYAGHQGRELGMSTWQADAWTRGGGATWGWLTADSALGLVFHGTGAPAPLNPAQRTGDNKWTSSIIAREITTGRVRWALQLTPGDGFGYDASNENLIADLTLAGREVKALVHFDRNGFAYTIDRMTGRILRAEKYGPANWATSVNLGTGVPARDPAFAMDGKKAGVCPSIMGMKTFQPAAWSPVSKLFFVPANNLCMDIEPVPAAFTAGRPFLGATIRITPGPGGNRGRFIAWDAATGAIAWENREAFPVFGGALATAGGLVFYGTLDGWFKAVDAATGRELWRFKAPSGFVGNPIAFADEDGRMYIAVVSGVGGWPGTALVPGARPTDGLGAVAALSDLARAVNAGGVLLVFGL